MAITERAALADEDRRARVTGPGPRWWLAPLLVYLFSRAVDAVLITLASADQVARSPEIGYVFDPAGAGPGYLTALGNWDGQWYGEIATHGYPADLPREDGEVVPNPWAFYPLFPALTKLLMSVSSLPFEVSATLVTTLAGAVAMLLLYRLVEAAGGPFNAVTAVAALSFFPAAPILQAAYADAVTLMLVLVCLWLLRAQRFPLLMLATVLLSLSRPVVLPLAAVIAVHGLIRWRQRDAQPFPVRERWWYAAAASVAVAAFGLWPLVAGLVTGEPNAYFATQRAWILDDAAGWPSWVVSVSRPGARALGVFGLLVFAFAVYAVVRRSGRVWGTELRLWSVLYLGYLVASTRPTTSILRYAMIAAVPAWPFTSPPESAPSTRRRVLTLSAIVLLGTALQWVWLRWFFIPHPGNHGFP